MVLLWILLIIVVIVLLVLIFKYKRPRIDTLNGITGQVGGGKTSSCICRIKSYLRRIYFLGRNRKKYKNDYIILANFPIGKLEKKTGKRYMRVWFKKIYCYDLDLKILTLELRLPQDEVIIVVDEFSSIVSQLNFNLPIVKDNFTESARTLRQYTHSKLIFFWLDQCSKEIIFPYRRRTAYAYNMIHSYKVPLLPIMIYEYRKILLSDEVDNVTLSKDTTSENDILKFYFFCNPFKYYDSCYLSDRYNSITDIMPLKNSLSLKRNDLMKLTKKSQYYKTLINDNITEEDYNKLYKK